MELCVVMARILLVLRACAAFVAVPPASVLRAAPRRASIQNWDELYGELSSYRSTWGTADAPLGDDLGRWCEAQRRLRRSGKLAEERVARLDSLGFSWNNPSQLSEDELEARWRDMVDALAAYRAAHGDAQVPKKWREDPVLGGWVAAVRRRGRDVLSADRALDLDRVGFEWVSTKACGSAFMKGFRRLRDWKAAAEPGDALPDDLRQWSRATRSAAAKGLLSRERLDYLGSIRFFDEDDAA